MTIFSSTIFFVVWNDTFKTFPKAIRTTSQQHISLYANRLKNSSLKDMSGFWISHFVLRKYALKWFTKSWEPPSLNLNKIFHCIKIRIKRFLRRCDLPFVLTRFVVLKCTIKYKRFPFQCHSLLWNKYATRKTFWRDVNAFLTTFCYKEIYPKMLP